VNIQSKIRFEAPNRKREAIKRIRKEEKKRIRKQTEISLKTVSR
jgi:hypothetical protein